MVNHRQLINKYEDDLLKCNHVVGVGYGPKEKQGKIINKKAIVVMVDEKLPCGELNSEDIVPQELGSYDTDVIETGQLKLLNSLRTQKMRPARPGISIGHYKISAGTLGAVVKDRQSGASLILSNNHVLANLSNGRDGRAKKGDPVLQPAIHDEGNKNEDILAELERYVPLIGDQSEMATCPVAQGLEKMINNFLHLIRPDYQFKLYKQKYKNTVDCAVARPVNKNDLDNKIMDIGAVNGIREPEPGLAVKKSGRTTGLTTGRVRAIDSTVEIRMSETRKAVFKNQFLTDPLSRPGDSGSLVVTNDNQAIGLLFAGSNQASVCNYIGNVLKNLDISF